MSFSRGDIEQIFRAFDADNSGQVSKEELIKLLTELFKNEKQAKECGEVRFYILKLYIYWY